MIDISGQQGGAPASVSPEASTTEQQTQEPRPLTAAEIERLVEEKATRIAQSMVDKAESRISKKAQEQIAAIELTRGTLGLTDEQVEQAKAKVIYTDLASPKPMEQASPTPTAQKVQPQEQLDPVIAETLETFKSEGVTIEPTDPEWKPLDAILKDPNGNIHQYRKELYRQIENKRQRQTANQEKAPARVVSGGQVNQSGDAPMSAREYLRRAHNK